MPIEWTTAAKFAAQGVYAAHSNRHVIHKFWTRALAKLDVGHTDICVTGHSAAGKSYLVGQFHGRARELSGRYLPESLRVEVDALTIGEWTKLVRVLPGQLSRRTSAEVVNIDANPELQGVIHVVDFGFVKPRNPAQGSALVKGNGLTTIERLRAYNLENELRELTDLSANLRRSRTRHARPKWLVIAVNKVDLYEADLHDALAYYHPDGGSQFGAQLKNLLYSFGSVDFGIYVIPTCAHESHFDWNGFKVPTSLNVKTKDQYLLEFVDALSNISERHA